MAVTVAHLSAAALSNNADQATYTIPSATYTAGRFYVFCTKTVTAGTDNTAPGTIVGDGGSPPTVTALVTQSSANQRRVTAYGSLPSSNYTGTFTLTPTPATPTGCMVIVLEVTGMAAGLGGSFTFNAVRQAVATASGGTSTTVDLAAFGDAVNNAAVGVFERGLIETMTLDGSGQTALAQHNFASPNSALGANWKLGEHDPTFSATTASSNSALGLELVAAAAGGPPAGSLLLLGVGR